MSCHDPAPGGAQATAALTAAPTVALVGNPNAGKSTLFNALTGARQTVMNAPGTTVDLQTGSWKRGRHRLTVVDLPGTYGLTPRSPDEEIAARYVAGRGVAGRGVAGRGSARPDLAVVVLDGAALARSLYLLAQVRETGTPVLAAVTMLDVAAARSVEPDLAALADAAGVPVVAIDPRTGAGLEALGVAVERLLAADGPAGAPLDVPDDEARFAWTERVLAAAVPSPPATPVRSTSDRIDRVLLHPWLGVPVFLAVMWAMFELTTAVATPLIDAVGGFVDGPLAAWLRGALPGQGWVEGLLVDGVLSGVGTVLSFVPLLALVFVGIGLLEDSGYLARAAFVADRALRGIGLDGRAMVPLVIGFGCNVPAMVATRTMPDARRRLLTGLLVPLTSCPARLTVYVLVAGAFFPSAAGTVVFGLYVFSGLLVVLGGLVLRATAFRDLRRTRPLVLALPAYQVPRLRSLLLSTWTRVAAFVRGAGGIITGTLVVVWVLAAIPVTGGHTVGEVPVHDSVYGRVADGIAPVLAPAGLDDWRIASALTTGFVAKEVVVGALAQSYSLDPADAGALAPDGALGEQLRITLDATSGGHATAAGLAFLVFVLAYTPCLATVAEQRRVFGGRWTSGAVVVQLAFAWLLAVAVFQVGRLLT
ncbi:ferrous iron transport protein B [Xylanimonas cellulosilytica DSM 15894]|uniref:Ferrous iron transport protein B n=1 Tax=Xylanimonas cellulosilytica (strain DSM 15894 / JCM 12276 / CECT 5975 / KCTC 9989 / LMG 20990 / NBRC 107835 / XIL07) TaxID=446471 RepID=D1BTH8_XYLCX|nr:ferrous iron transport protein B [Xylanimonas cellulosilytica]ACZ30957.1 ferrous iron transport protein B [Xylanimonas cellulosilytica DSM 15894]